ncbi:MAG: hypothetical protein SFU83_08925 [Meiothermus sp.]|nr:hypothetical protein [Meiothermus sp.]
MNRLPQEKPYIDVVSWYVLVVGYSEVLELESIGDKHVIKIWAGYLENFNLLSETVFLAENHDDVEFYQSITEIYQSATDNGKIKLVFEPRGGGGHTTVAEYNSIQNRRDRLCLCILDSDFRYQGSSHGQTCSAVMRIDDPLQPLCVVHTLQVREIENLIPTSFYAEAVTGDPNREKALQSLVEIESVASGKARHFVDLKKGHRLYELLSVSSDSPKYQYWKSILEALGTSIVCAAPNHCNRREECICVTFFGFGDAILRYLLNFIKQKKAVGTPLQIDAKTQDEWRECCELIIAWCCGSTPIAT